MGHIYITDIFLYKYHKMVTVSLNELEHDHLASLSFDLECWLLITYNVYIPKNDRILRNTLKKIQKNLLVFALQSFHKTL